MPSASSFGPIFHCIIIFLKEGERHDQAFPFHRLVVFISLLREERESSGTEQGKERSPVSQKIHQQMHVEPPPCFTCVAYISVMVSGRLVGISVSPFPLQSTMLLLQVQDSGHCSTLHAEDDDDW